MVELDTFFFKNSKPLQYLLLIRLTSKTFMTPFTSLHRWRQVNLFPEEETNRTTVVARDPQYDVPQENSPSLEAD